MTLTHVAITAALALPFLVALVDVLRMDMDGSRRITWVMVVVLLPIVGALAWFAVGRRSATKPSE
jgi:heme/copper-type cytochrome/quinol oxidase subunit 2